MPLEVDEVSAAQPEGLAEGWCWARLGDICTPPQYGWTTSANRGKGQLKLLRTSDISDGHVDWESVPYCEDVPQNPEKYLVRAGDILVSRAGSVGLSYLVNHAPRAVFASYLIRFRPISPINSQYLALYFKSPYYWSAVVEQTAGITIPNVNASKLGQLAIPVPPLREQKCIVDAVQTLLRKLGSAQDHLSAVLSTLRMLRESVLAATCSGTLTAEWRRQKQPKFSSVALADRLQIQARSDGVEWFEPNFDICERQKLPEGWSYVALGNLGKWQSGGTPSKAIPAYWNGGRFPWVSPKDMKTELITDSKNHITAVGAAQLKAIPENSVLFVVRGLILAHTFPVAVTSRQLTINQDIRALIPHRGVLSSYVLRALQSESRSILSVVRDSTHGTRRLESGTLKTWPIALPPTEEQEEIAHCVNAVFQLTEVIERRVVGATSCADALMKSILAKAFRGELVPTEAELAHKEGRDYEPASVLLERIRAERPLARAATRASRSKRSVAYSAAAGDGSGHS